MRRAVLVEAFLTANKNTPMRSLIIGKTPQSKLECLSKDGGVGYV